MVVCNIKADNKPCILSLYFVWRSSVELTFCIGLLNTSFLLLTEALFSLSAHCRVLFFLSDENGMSLMGQRSVHLLKVKRHLAKVECLY